jgi:hypothetical protein
MTTYDNILSKVEAQAGSEASRTLIISRLLDYSAGKDLGALFYARYRNDSYARQRILRCDHPDFPDLTKLKELEVKQRWELRDSQRMLELDRRKSYAAEKMEWCTRLDLQQKVRKLAEARQEIKRKIRARIVEILTDSVFSKEEPRLTHNQYGWTKVRTGPFSWKGEVGTSRTISIDYETTGNRCFP